MSPEVQTPVADAEVPSRVPGFTVALPQFEGPFDLLLSLITRRRLDVTELALAEVTDEFLAHMRADWDLGHASEFVVVAATLLALKAHRLLPHDEDEDDEDLELLEARDVLFARLLQYRAYKEASDWLRRTAATASRSHPRIVGSPDDLAALLPQLIRSTTPEQLARAAVRALTRPADPGVETVHLHERVAVSEQIGVIAMRLRAHGALPFSELVADAGSTAVVVARFLAILLMHRQGSADLSQDEAMGEITVTWCGGEDDLTGIMVTEDEEEFE